jgi:vitamin B12 transporter
MRKKIQLCCTLAILASASMTSAETINKQGNGQAPEKTSNMEEIVVTATRSAEKIQNIPAKVEIIHSKEIEQTIGETLTEQLKKNSSIGVIEYPGVSAGIGIRGFRPEFLGITKHTLILINGRPAGATNLATILAVNIEKIEVLKGPASSLYGGEAMGGVVNIITKKNTGKLAGVVELGIGSFNTTTLNAAIGGNPGGQFDFDISARRLDQSDDFKMGNGKTRANTSYQTQNSSIRVGADLNDLRLDLSGEIYQGRDIETPGDTFAGDTKSGHKDIDRHGLDFSIKNKSEANTLGFTAYITNETLENYNHYTGYSTITQVAPYQNYDSETNWLGFQIKDEFTYNSHRFVTGFDYQDISKESRSYNQDGSRKAPYSPDEGRENIAVYLETIWQLMDERLTATAGGRYDNFSVETKATPHKTDFTPNSECFSTFSPRAGLNYIFDQGLRLHTTLGKAFVPPSAAQIAGYSERVTSGGVTMITRGNAAIKPESSLTFDLGAGYNLPLLGISVDLTYFNTSVDDQISRVTSGNITTYQNSLSAEMDGLETTFSFDIAAPLELERSIVFYINSTHMFSAEEEQSDGTIKDIQNVAKYTVNYGIQYEDNMFDGKLHCRNQGKMKDTDWNTSGYPEVEYPDFTVFDLMLGLSFMDHHRVILKADNILDKDYYEKKGFPKPGRSFMLNYLYKF